MDDQFERLERVPLKAAFRNGRYPGFARRDSVALS